MVTKDDLSLTEKIMLSACYKRIDAISEPADALIRALEDEDQDPTVPQLTRRRELIMRLIDAINAEKALRR